MTNKLSACGFAVAICLPALAAAQASHASPPAYVSAFADYKPYRDIPVGNWRAVNDAVAPAAGRAGANAGHPMPGMPAPAASAPALPGHDPSHRPVPGSTR